MAEITGPYHLRRKGLKVTKTHHVNFRSSSTSTDGGPEEHRFTLELCYDDKSGRETYATIRVEFTQDEARQVLGTWVSRLARLDTDPQPVADA